MLTISVPATSANLGPGFDSIGLALDMQLTLQVLQPSDHWQIDHPFGADVPTDERNLIIKTALHLVPDLQPQHLQMASKIPLARGLGSLLLSYWKLPLNWRVIQITLHQPY